ELPAAPGRARSDFSKLRRPARPVGARRHRPARGARAVAFRGGLRGLTGFELFFPSGARLGPTM
ncbi:MAG TPA: hypothetical protein VK986_15965, partial [Tepidisphaeraceae bacterium]|nr:hypothetical protein [Tepidisphaeraceae bacterium]